METNEIKEVSTSTARETLTKFDFYDLGTVKRDFFSRWLDAPGALFSMEVEGDESGTCIIAFEKAPKDLSMAAELANIICSKTVALWSSLSLEPWEISPPRFHDPEERSFESTLLILRSLPRATVISQSYSFAFQDGPETREKNRLQMVFFPKTQTMV